jgi:hypothetical protein
LLAVVRGRGLEKRERRRRPSDESGWCGGWFVVGVARRTQKRRRTRRFYAFEQRCGGWTEGRARGM